MKEGSAYRQEQDKGPSHGRKNGGKGGEFATGREVFRGLGAEEAPGPIFGPGAQQTHFPEALTRPREDGEDQGKDEGEPQKDGQREPETPSRIHLRDPYRHDPV